MPDITATDLAASDQPAARLIAENPVNKTRLTQ